MRTRRYALLLQASLVAVCVSRLTTQGQEKEISRSEVTARIDATDLNHSHKAEKTPPAVIWLKPERVKDTLPMAPGKFTLLQKNKMFTPHLLVVPIGSSVAFPNADPFFHNVFSLFDGQRFDLGLYEAGSSRSVVFSREGVSYIFCNIHSEMSAVVIALSTPFYSLADAKGGFRINDVPDGEYELHIWIEGQKQHALNLLTRRVVVSGGATDLGKLRSGSPEEPTHLNKFGKPYEPNAVPTY